MFAKAENMQTIANNVHQLPRASERASERNRANIAKPIFIIIIIYPNISSIRSSILNSGTLFLHMLNDGFLFPFRCVFSFFSLTTSSPFTHTLSLSFYFFLLFLSFLLLFQMRESILFSCCYVHWKFNILSKSYANFN